MLLSKVLGVIVIARNGDRYSCYQDPNTYEASNTKTTALGEVSVSLGWNTINSAVVVKAESYQLGSLLRSTYLQSSSPSYINGMRMGVADDSEIEVRVKAGVEENVVFDSATAVLQGLFPPNPNNKIVLANGTTVLAPLGGYQYIPLETVEPRYDRSLESWTDCPAFQEHIKDFYASEEFREKAGDAQPFFNDVKDYVFDRPTTLENIWNIYDFISTELTHNKTYAYRLPPTYIQQARALADFHEDGVFSDKEINGIGNIAGRTTLHVILSSLQRMAFNGDPLRFSLIVTTYQPFISLFHQTGIISAHPELKGIPDYASALVFELRRGRFPDFRHFVRARFRNGTTEDFRDLHVFGHRADIPLTEFIYRAGNAVITSNRQWEEICRVKSFTMGFLDMVTGDKIYSALSGALALSFALMEGHVNPASGSKVMRNVWHGTTPYREKFVGDHAAAYPLAQSCELNVHTPGHGEAKVNLMIGQ